MYIGFMQRYVFDYQKTREECAKRGMNLAWLARELRVSPMTVYRWMGGQVKPRYVSIMAIAEILDVKPEDLMAS